MNHVVSFRAGDVLIVEGAYTSEAYVLDRGRVEVYLKGPPERRLRILNPGDIFGEMALITEQPRSASVRALEDIEVRVVDRDEFVVIWQHDPDALLPVLKVLCERIRTLTGLVAELTGRSAEAREAVQMYLGGGDAPPSGPAAGAAPAAATLEGISTTARGILGGRRVVLDDLPYRIGRATTSADPLSHNHLAIADREPFRVSRNHCMVVRVDDRWFLIDRGSHRGTIVNGTLIGGGKHIGRVQLWDGPNELVLGDQDGPYRFRLTIGPLASIPL